MTLFDEIKCKLEKHPQFRERRLRDEDLVVLALRSMGKESEFNDGKNLDRKEMAEFAKKYDSYRHEYDAVMRECPELQGSDYPDGKALAQEKQLEFGYQPGHVQASKMVMTAAEADRAFDELTCG